MVFKVIKLYYYTFLVGTTIPAKRFMNVDVERGLVVGHDIIGLIATAIQDFLDVVDQGCVGRVGGGSREGFRGVLTVGELDFYIRDSNFAGCLPNGVEGFSV